MHTLGVIPQSAAILRHLQVKWLSGDEVDIGTMVAVENVFNRTAAALGTQRKPKDVLDINSYLAKGSEPKNGDATE